VTATGGTSISHDGSGNVSAIGGASYGYTSDNNLATAGSEHYAYDAAGRMYYQNSDGTVFNYDGDQLIVETNGSSVLRRYVPGPNVDEPLVWYEGSGTSTRRWLHADERGSVVAVSDASGNLVGSNPNRYDEYGNPQGTLTGRFGFTGQAWLPTSNLYYYRARMYNPALSGRFMQTDPIGFGGGMNLYAYVRNNPVNFSDPLGLQCDGCNIPIDAHTNPVSTLTGSGILIGASSSMLQGRQMSENPDNNVVVTATRLGLPTIGNVLTDIFSDPTPQGRELNIRDLGTTEGGIITVTGRIWVAKNSLMLWIYELRARRFSFGRRGIIFQSIEHAMETARRLGLRRVVISPSLANPELQRFMSALIDPRLTVFFESVGGYDI
jgi:RHS repeat-associated protein